MLKLYSILAIVFIAFGSSAVGLEDLLSAPASDAVVSNADVVVSNLATAVTNVNAIAVTNVEQKAASVEPKAEEPVEPKSSDGDSRRQAMITSDSVTYDRKEGFAVFNGNVFVDDAMYQMHADKVVVFMKGTNDLERIVAMGNVALTNGLKSASGIKASYHRDNGMVVLYGDEKTPAVVRDETEKGTQSVVGERIRFWIDKERVEVIKALISAPIDSFDHDDLRKAL